MEADYLQASLPEPVVILGQRLEPFSVGHMEILRRFGNRYVGGSEAPMLHDLMFGVLVCAQRWEQAAEAVTEGISLNDWWWGNKRLSVLEFLEAWLKELGPFDFAAKHKEFLEYLEAGCKWPDLQDPDEQARMPGAPFLQRVRLVLQGHIGLSRSEAMNYPWGLAVHDYFAFWEMEGRAKIMSGEDYELLAEVKRLKAEMIAEIKGELEAAGV